MKIYGAGMAGLLAGNMLRRHQPIIFEAQDSLPNNHSALLRFRTDKVANATHIPFKKVTVRKAIKYRDKILTIPSIPACNEYSMKVTGKAMGRSIWSLNPVERFIAPSDFISQSAANLNIEYGEALGKPQPCISTIPMPILMDIVKWKDKPEFNYSPIWSYQLDLGSKFDIYQTIYYADEYNPIYRASITGNILIVEFIKDPFGLCPTQFKEAMSESLTELVRKILADFGITYTSQTDDALYDDVDSRDVKYQKFGKLLPIDEQIRKEFILAMSDKYEIYSLGRFATWRQLLMDDVVNDVKVIEKFITERDGYKRKLVS